MTAMLWIVGAIIALILIVVAIAVYLRVARSHSKSLDREQARLDKQAGISVSTETKSKTGGDKPNCMPEWLMPNLWSILLTVAAIVILYGLYASWKSPSLASIGEFGKGHWLWILSLWGIIATLIAINKTALKEVAGILQSIIAIAAFLLVVGFPLAAWVMSPSAPKAQRQEQVNIPLASLPAAKWPKLAIAPHGRIDLTPVPGMNLQVSGFGADIHTVYTDGHEASIPVESTGSNPDGPIASVYVTNRTGKEIYISYAFAP